MSNHLAIVPPAPRTPSDAAERTVLRYEPGGWVSFVLGGAFLVMGSIFTIIFMAGVPSDLALRLFGAPATGVVTRAGIARHVRSNHVSPRFIDYEYRVGDHMYASSSYADPDGPLDEVTQASTVKIEVLPQMPSVSRVVGGQCAPFGLSVAFVLLFPIVGLVVIVWPIMSRARRRNAYVNGTAVVGRSEGIGPSNMRINGRTVPKVTWTYEVAGQSYSDWQYIAFDSPLHELVAGTRVMVLYTPETPKRSVLYIA